MVVKTNTKDFELNLSEKNDKLYNPHITVFTNDTVELNINLFEDKQKTIPKNLEECKINLYVEREIDNKVTFIEQLEDEEYITKTNETEGQFKIILKNSIVEFESVLSLQFKIITEDTQVSCEPFLILVESAYAESEVLEIAKNDVLTLNKLYHKLDEYNLKLSEITKTASKCQEEIDSAKLTLTEFTDEYTKKLTEVASDTKDKLEKVIEDGNIKINQVISDTKDKLEVLENKIKSISDDYNNNSIRSIKLKKKDISGSNLIYFETDTITNLADLLKSSFQINVGGYTSKGYCQQAYGIVLFNTAFGSQEETLQVYTQILIDKNIAGNMVSPKVSFSNMTDKVVLTEKDCKLVIKTSLAKHDDRNNDNAYCVFTPISNFK